MNNAANKEVFPWLKLLSVMNSKVNSSQATYLMKCSQKCRNSTKMNNCRPSNEIDDYIKLLHELDEM